MVFVKMYLFIYFVRMCLGKCMCMLGGCICLCVCTEEGVGCPFLSFPSLSFEVGSLPTLTWGLHFLMLETGKPCSPSSWLHLPYRHAKDAGVVR